MKIALITPIHKEDYLTNTVIDGLFALQGEDPSLTVAYSSNYSTYLPIKSWHLDMQKFVEYAESADLIIFCWGKGNTDFENAQKIGRWNKTLFIDGSELGRNKRLDENIKQAVIDGTYEGQGAINKEILNKVALYFRREKPYREGIIPLPFGIERRYTKHYLPDKKRDVDFVCIFGQLEYPPLRGEVMEYLRRSDLRVITKPTNRGRFLTALGFGLKDGGRDRFYNLLSRTKVGISVSGGGYDTARFWEILASGCILLTESIDIYEPGSNELAYKRIWQFKDMTEFKLQIAKLASYIQNEYNQDEIDSEYKKILAEHSTKARVIAIINAAKAKGIIK